MAPVDVEVIPKDFRSSEDLEGHVTRDGVTFNCSAVTEERTPLVISWTQNSLPLSAESDPRITIVTVNVSLHFSPRNQNV